MTQGNLNNDIGVPLTLMRLTAEHEVLVAELGANHAGEIDYLAGLVQPTVALITNAAAAHLEGFGSLEGVATAKGELLDHLPKAGTAVLNADDPFFADWRARAPCEFVTSFGFAASADCTLLGEPRVHAGGATFTMRLPEGEEVAINLPLLGRQNVANALAAAAAAQAVGASVEDIVAGLARATAVRGRLNAIKTATGALIIDDSYNANPGSVRAALDYLSQLSGTRIFVLGDMAELGAEGLNLHHEIGTYAIGRCDLFVANRRARGRGRAGIRSVESSVRRNRERVRCARVASEARRDCADQGVARDGARSARQFARCKLVSWHVNADIADRIPDAVLLRLQRVQLPDHARDSVGA